MTKKLKCIIIDDEPKARENIRLLINEYCPAFEVIGEAGDKEAIKKLIKSKKADVLFLDVQIGYTTIFDLLDFEDVKHCRVVFITAHQNYALKGYSFKAIDYLLKPINSKELEKVYHHIFSTHNTITPSDQLFHEVNQLLAQQQRGQKITLVDSSGLQLVGIDDIMYCLGEGTYTTFYLADNSQKVVSKNLKVFEEKLSPFNFFRLSKSSLINLNFLHQFSKEGGGYVIMKDEKQLTISRNQKKAFLKLVESLTI